VWRTQAVTSMLVEDVAEIRIVDVADASTGAKAHPELAERPEIQALAKARRRAILVSLVDWIALTVLLSLSSGSGPFLPFTASTDTVFTLGVLAVAMHSGFRLGQARTYKTVSRVCLELWQRQAD
jgi:hypothetical protein